MVGWFALALSVFYAMQVPLCLCLRADTVDGRHVGWGVGIIGTAGARRRAGKPDSPKHVRRRTALWLEKQVWIRAAWSGADYLYTHRLLLRVQFDVTLGGMDADKLALCYGAGIGLLEALHACTDGRVTGHLRADFSAPVTFGEVRLTYAARTGVVLRAAWHTVRNAWKEKMSEWISIPLKAS